MREAGEMDRSTFHQILQGAIAGSHKDLELLLELYQPIIRKHAHINGMFNDELYQYLLIHIALNIHKFVL